MNVRVRGLSPEPFAPLFQLDDGELAKHGAARRIADAPHSFPCRVSLEDAAPGEELLLLTYPHLDVATPYRGAGPIYVRRGAKAAFDGINEIPDQLRRRLLSLRAYDADGWMLDSEVAPGSEIEPL